MKLKLNLQFSSHFPFAHRLSCCSAVMLLCFCLFPSWRSCAEIVILHFSRWINMNFFSPYCIYSTLCVWWKSIVIYYCVFCVLCRNWKLSSEGESQHWTVIHTTFKLQIEFQCPLGFVESRYSYTHRPIRFYKFHLISPTRPTSHHSR